MVEFESLSFVLIVLGLIPWQMSRTVVRRRGRKHGMRWQVVALFWRLSVERPVRGDVSWRFTIPAIRRLRSVVWAVLDELVER